MRVTVFGASHPQPDSAEYKEAEKLGHLLAEAQFDVATGGYFGTMEAVSKGAAEAQRGVEITGITVPSIFKNRTKDGNSYSTKHIYAESVLQRIEFLMSESQIFICLPGRLGTLMELVAVWNDHYCRRSTPDHKTALLILWENPWKEFVECCSKVTQLENDALNMPPIRYVSSPEEALQAIRDHLN